MRSECVIYYLFSLSPNIEHRNPPTSIVNIQLEPGWQFLFEICCLPIQDSFLVKVQRPVIQENKILVERRHPVDEGVSCQLCLKLFRKYIARILCADESAVQHILFFTTLVSILGTATVQRTPLQLSAAQRLEMLHDSLDMQGTDMRYSRGESIAARRAQFLKETVRSNISSSSLASGRAPSGRSTPMPNGYMV